MRSVRVEVKPPNGTWRDVGRVYEALGPGSISSYPPEGRQVLLFGWDDGSGPAVWRSVGGVDLEDRVIREVHTIGLETVALLNEPFEMDYTPAVGSPGRLRFTLEGS